MALLRIRVGVLAYRLTPVFTFDLELGIVLHTTAIISINIFWIVLTLHTNAYLAIIVLLIAAFLILIIIVDNNILIVIIFIALVDSFPLLVQVFVTFALFI